MICGFWIVLAVLFFALAISGWVLGNRARKNLNTFKDKTGGLAVMDDDPEKGTISFTDNMIDAFNIASLINFIGFILAAAAAVLSAFSQ